MEYSTRCTTNTIRSASVKKNRSLVRLMEGGGVDEQSHMQRQAGRQRGAVRGAESATIASLLVFSAGCRRASAQMCWTYTLLTSDPFVSTSTQAKKLHVF